MQPTDIPADATLPAQARALVAGEPNRVANLANIAALVFHALDRVNWVGFYLRDEQRDELVLGPFQGKPACIRIPWGRGVCGTAAATAQVQRIADVHAFDGHIACDPASHSELVIPLIEHGRVIGVFDLDSPDADRFSEADAALLEQVVAALDLADKTV
ncbi:MAG: GAF domain-containing protein [Abyssibacter sp.]|nr:GAF domain-containing protein [Abyssibacter sp.]MCK5859238.1 GAF domain-containing protein [Abyssibacter sp.]